MERHDVSISHPRCPYCHDEVSPSHDKVACASCMGWQHPECWEAHGACGACGSSSALRGQSVAEEEQLPWYRRPAGRADWTLGATGAFVMTLGLGLLNYRRGPWLGLLVVLVGLFAVLTGIHVWRRDLRRAREGGEPLEAEGSERGSSKPGAQEKAL